MSEPESYGPCLARSGCNRRAVGKHHLCRDHNQGGEGWHREHVTRADGSTFSYIAKDHTSPPMLVDARSVLRIVGEHKPIAGRCPGCTDPFSVSTSFWVDHLTWGAVWRTSVCHDCGTKAQRWLLSMWAFFSLAGARWGPERRMAA